MPVEHRADIAPSPDRSRRKAFLVLGPHRSGTSVITRALLCAGLDLGQQLLEPNADNPKGFFENARIVGFNDQLLKHLDRCWDYVAPHTWEDALANINPDWLTEAAELVRTQFSTTSDIAIKDPRLCLLAAFWEQVLQSAGFDVQYVLVARHPVEAAESQRSRYIKDPVFHHVGATLAEGVLLWANYTQAALGFLAGKTFVSTAYADFVAQPESALRALSSALGAEFPEAAVREFVDGFLDEKLQRHSATTSEADADFEPYIQVYQALIAAAPDAAALQRQLLDAMASDPRVLASVARSYVQARHGNIESRLELVKAGNIIAYQEYALAQAQKQLAEHESLLIAAKEQFIAERRERDQLMLKLAAYEDQSGTASRRDAGH